MQRNLFPLRLIHKTNMSPHYSRHYFWLIVRRCKVKRKRHPQRKSFSMTLFAGNQQATFRNIPCFADLGLLPQRRNPPKPYGKAQTYPGMLTLLHRAIKFKDECRGKRDYTPLIPKLL